jgi:hypothetical protein
MHTAYTITLAIGMILFFISIFLFNRSLNFIKSGERTTATVIQLEEVSDSDGSTYRPIFKFSTYANQEIIFRHSASSSPSAFDIGEEVSIIYNRDQPEKAQLLTYMGSFVGTIVLMAIAMPFIVVGGGYFFMQQF